jgi:FkbH-like protein/FkbM family methyltransferase
MNPLLNASKDRPLEASAEFKVGVRSMPYLADHGFQDMIVLPGAFYIASALRMEREHFDRIRNCVRNVAFHNPVILSAEDTVIKVEASKLGDGRTEYVFYEAGVEQGHLPPRTRQVAARLEVDANSSIAGENRVPALSIETFQAQTQTVMGSQLYPKLRDNGNQYGPRFQNVSALWRVGDQILGRLSVPRHIEPHQLDPSLLDSVTQLLAFFIVEKGKTFVLRAIERIEITDVNFPDTLWGHATVLPQNEPNENGLVGNVRVFDQSGKPYLELSGVTFSLLDRVEIPNEKPANIVIAANFTTEPLEDSLNFWGDHFGVPFHTEFAPYNQVFRQLLDPGSAFRRNGEGVNVVLLQLEEWAHSTGSGQANHPPHGMERGGQGERLSATTPDKERMEQCFGNRARYVLPNGLEIVHLNQYETDYVYKEIFEDECYLKHGIRLQDGDTVVDIGANIGLFSLFVLSRCQNPTIYAFEPAPVVYDLLKANGRAHGFNIQAVNAGVSDKARTATFTFYERSSVFSSFHADEAEDRKAIQTVVHNMLNAEAAAGESVDEYVNELTADRLRRQTCECQLVSVSDIIRENRIDTIDLLKIDAEKSELDILKGIADGDWLKISQIVMEIHDGTGKAVKRIEELLGKKGFRCVVEREKLLEHSGLFNLYATRQERIRPGSSTSNVSKAREPAAAEMDALRAGGLKRNIEDFSTALRSFAKHATAPLVFCVCPRSPAAESDAGLRSELNEAEASLQSEAGTMPNVHMISSARLLQCYPVKDHYDPHGHALGHIPYTPECYAAIGTAVCRTIFNLKRRQFKVIVLDCDHTLWKGVCGEDGPQGIEISPQFRTLQEFMIERMRAGMLLCLCSKNNEEDVLDVFAQRIDMPLKREHLVSWRLNWNRKSENLKSLAQELNLGLDSFIFIDDNPIECAEVRINCPNVLTLQLPRNAESFASFLNHVWAFDHSGATEEDRKRTRMYQESAQRKQFRVQALSLKDYIEGLQLRVEVAELTDDELSRVSQLTFRTNQFNFTTIRRSEQEIRDFLDHPGANCLVVRVTDRFGDYGLAGVVMYKAKADRFEVDTFLLSCRVLGRGVEYAVVSHLGQRAAREERQFVELPCLPTEKNQPVREFLTGIGARFRNDDGPSWTFPAEFLASVKYDPDNATNGPEVKAIANPENVASTRAWDFDAVDLSERLQRIGEEWCDTSQLGKAIEEHRLKREGEGFHETHPPALSPPGGERASGLEAALLNIWRKVLCTSRIGVNDNFFEVGGTSLRAVQVIVRIKSELKQTLSIVSLFECPTVALLAARLGVASDKVQVEATTASAVLRGKQRRSKSTRRTVV